MSVLGWFRERRRFREEKARRIQQRLRQEEPALLDSLSSMFTGLPSAVHKAGRIEAEVEAEMRRERLLGKRRK